MLVQNLISEFDELTNYFDLSKNGCALNHNVAVCKLNTIQF